MSTKWTALRLRCAGVFAGLMLATMLFAPMAAAQMPNTEQKAGDARSIPQIQQTFYLTNATQSNALNDIQTDLRSMLPRAAIYGEASQNAISVRGSAEDVAQAGKMIAELDRPTKVYRLTYTIVTTDGGKRIGAERFSLVVTAEGKTVLKQGSRVPLVTGTYNAEGPKQGEQVQYQDVGLNIEASLNGERVRTKVEQTSISDEKASAHDPVFRQTVLEGQSNLTLGKAVVLGSFDVPGSTRHEEIEVTAELVS